MKLFLTVILIFIKILLFSQEIKISIDPIKISLSNSNDFSPSIYKDGILFLSDRKSKYPFYDLYYYDNKKLVKIKSDPSWNVGQAFYDKKNDELYVVKNNTRKHYENSVIMKNNLAVFKARLIKNKLKIGKKLSFCKPKFSYSYPSIFDDKMIILTNDFSETKESLYQLVEMKKVNGKWVKNKIIISEATPMVGAFYLNKNNIIFSSKRKGGKGGLDLYIITKNNKEQWSNPINLDIFNSEFDDFDLIFTEKNKGYFSSNRIDNKDHIFKFAIEKK